jgi:hypothetical protein
MPALAGFGRDTFLRCEVVCQECGPSLSHRENHDYPCLEGGTKGEQIRRIGYLDARVDRIVDHTNIPVGEVGGHSARHSH